MIVRIVPVVLNNVQTIEKSYENAPRKIANDPDDRNDLDRLDRVESGRSCNFEAIIWKRSQTIEGCPRNHHFYSSNRE